MSRSTRVTTVKYSKHSVSKIVVSLVVSSSSVNVF